MPAYCRSCDAGADAPDATEEGLCDDCQGALTYLARTARSWCDPDGDSTEDLRRAIRYARDMGFDSAEIADVAAAECAGLGLAGEVRDLVAGC